ncbi:hypothetical protein P5V47_05495 [Mycobacteroides abscessus subsp. massiliense]|uniref:hypothetical protein n=1 Tax=Mycobacteroides abscessus TaxID=36809 RepID=UPI00266B4E78|nr:hypothetical protein [Mycobacteroides abscessus]MDO3298143.1 hypothetical protein [Mycobacteroides abscessus subsp. massiliense]
MTTTSDNPAIALRDILRAVMRSGVYVEQAWARLLGAGPGAPEFAARHSEVVSLWKQVNELLLGLPEDDDDRNQYSTYMHHYYNAIVFPGDWSKTSAAHVADGTLVDHLTGIATTLRYRVLTTPAVNDAAVDRLRESIAEWRRILSQADFDASFAAELRAQINHLEWLLDNMSLFGARPIVEASKELTGTSVVAMGKKPSFAKRIGKAMGGVVAFLALFHTGVEETVGIIEGVTEMRDAVVKIISPQKEIEGPELSKSIEGPPTIVGPTDPSALPNTSGQVVDVEYEVTDETDLQR